MNRIATIAFASAIGFIGLACGWTAPASAQVDPGMNVAVGSTAGITDGTREAAVREYYNQFLGRDAGAGAIGELLPAVMPTGQKAVTDGTRGGNDDGRAELIAGAYGDVLGRDTSGGENGLIGLLNQEATGRKAGDVSMDRMTTDQLGGDGKAELIVGAGDGGENGLIGLLRPQGMPTDQLLAVQKDSNFVPAVQNVGRLGSLMGVGSASDLFLGNRADGGESLLPAVQKVREAAAQTEGAGPHVNPGVAKGLNFSNQGIPNNTAGGGNAGAPKGIAIVKTTR